MSAENLADVVAMLCATVDRAAAYSRRERVGLQVPSRDDFHNAPPSVITRLEWWARRLRACADFQEPEPPGSSTPCFAVEALPPTPEELAAGVVRLVLSVKPPGRSS